MFFLAPQNWAFSIAFLVLLTLAALELFGTLVAASPSALLDHALPDVDFGEGVLGWLHIGKVPLLILLALFLAGFAFTGFVLQSAVHSATGTYFPATIASLIATISGVFVLRTGGRVVAKVVPKDETYGVSSDDLIGRVGVITGGDAKRGLGAQAKVFDVFAKPHYVLIEPDDDDRVLSNGSQVLLVRRVGARYFAIPNPHPNVL